MIQVRGAPTSPAQRCCGRLHKSPDLQTDDSTLCGCVSVWVVLGGTEIMETVTWGRWDCVGGFLCTDVSPSVPARGLWQCLWECSQISTNVVGQYPWLCWDMARVLACHGVGPGFLDPYVEHCLWAVLLIVNQNYWDQTFCSVSEPTIQLLPWEK